MLARNRRRRGWRAHVLACALVLAGQAAWSGQAWAQPDAHTITLIHLNDLHANLIPHLDLERVEAGEDTPAHMRVVERGGIARIATLIQQIRSDNPHSVLMNVGDTYHGGVEALYTRGNAIVPAVNALGVDIGVPGNWDFAYGAATTRMRYAAKPSRPARFMNWLFWDGPVERPNFPNLAANLTQTLPPLAKGDLLLPGTRILDVGGVRVGFIGLTSDIVPRMAAPFAWGFAFLQGEEEYRALIDRLAAQLRQDGATVVVVMSELGLHRDHRLAQIIRPGVDVFFSAHTHEATFVPLESASGAVVVESGNDTFLGRMDLTVRDGVIIARAWRLLPVEASIPEDETVRELVDAARAPFLAPDVNMEYPAPWVKLPLTRPIDTVVGHVDRLLHRRSVLENPFNALLAEVMRRLAGTQVSMTPGFRFDAVVLPEGAQGAGVAAAGGEITLEHLYRFLPIAPSLAVGEVRAADLRKVLETELMRVFSTDAFKHSGGWFGGFGGLEIDVDLSRPDGERVQGLRLWGAAEPFRDDDVISVVSCIRPFDEDNVMCSNPNFSGITEVKNDVTGRAWTPLEVLLQAFETGEATVKTHANVRQQGSVPLWPAARFIQPLTQDASSLGAAHAATDRPMAQGDGLAGTEN